MQICRGRLSLYSRDSVMTPSMSPTPDCKRRQMNGSRRTRVSYARLVRAAVLTRDLDFADIRHYPPQDYFGILVLRLPDDAVIAQILNVVEQFLGQQRAVEQIVGRLIVLEPDHFRARPPLE
jgi:hypothetical protein